MAAHGHFHWNELMTHDVEKAKAFYAQTVGWTFEAMQMANGMYWVAKMDGQPVGGLFPMTGPDFAGMREQWVSYLAVDDIDARFKKAVASGANVMREPFDVPTVGRIAYLTEQGGAIVAWITPVLGPSAEARA
jgi:uncharacterized protein